MTNLKTKNILIGITGGIGAYKSAELVRLLKKQGCDVRVCMTVAATKFITPLTMQALSGNTVHTDLLDTQAEAAMGHIELARWAEQVIIAPATADFIAKLAHGLADNLLTTLCLATASPIAIAPAMNQQMWKNLAVRQNVELLSSREIQLLGPAEGEQACGDVGLGRMIEPYEIVDALQDDEAPYLLAGVHILITAGATREAIDPVRFITNRSSGKMGYAIADAAKKMGADVTLISGVVSLPTPDNVQRRIVESANDMYEETMRQADAADIFIATAAVSDYSPKHVIKQKIKKTADQIVIELTKNPDILAELSSQFPHVFTVGFAAETNDLIYYARKKMENKKLNMIAANWVGGGKGFDQADNALEVLWQNGQKSLPQMNKQQLAKELLILVADKFNKDKTNAND